MADRHARRMDEHRHLAIFGPLPKRIGVLAVDEAAVPAGADQHALESERHETTLAFGDLPRFKRIERTHAPIAGRTRNDPGNAVVDRFDDVERRRF